MSNGNDYRSILLAAESYRQQQLYDFALAAFNKGIEQLQKQSQQDLSRDEATSRLLEWAWAHKGETYLQMASKSTTDFRIECYRKALYYFNKAIGVQNDNEEDPKIELEPNLEKVANPNPEFAWTFAHRGETLRALMFEYDLQKYFSGKSREDFFEAAKTSFNKALEASKKYAWAHAHLGATYINWRGGEEDYKKAIVHFSEAIRLRNLNYPWALAYKAGAYELLYEGNNQKLDQITKELESELNKIEAGGNALNLVKKFKDNLTNVRDTQSKSFYLLLAAVIENNAILTELLDPPTEYGMSLTPGAQYINALAQYHTACKKEPLDEIDYIFINYYYAIAWMVGGLLSWYGPKANSLPNLPDKYHALVWKRVTNRGRTFLPDPQTDLHFGLVEEIKKEINQEEKKYYGLAWTREPPVMPHLLWEGPIRGEEILTDISNSIKQFIDEKLQSAGSNLYKDDIFYMIGGVLARTAHIFHEKDLQTEALNFLKAALNCAQENDQPDRKVQSLIDRAKTDMAWYGLHVELNKLFQDME